MRNTTGHSSISQGHILLPICLACWNGICIKDGKCTDHWHRISEYGHFYTKLVWIAEIILSLLMSNAWPERGASAVKRVKSRLPSKMTNQMLEVLLHIPINKPPVGEEQELLKEAVETWSNAKNKRKLPPSANPGGTSSGNSQSQVQAILADSAVQTDIQVQEDENVEEASVQAEVEASVEAFKLADHQASYDLDDSAFESEDEY